MYVLTYRDPSLVAGQSTVVVTPSTPLPVTIAADSITVSDNLAQIAGVAVDANSGNKSAGTLRVVLATDQPQLTAALKVDGSAVTQPVDGATASGVTVANPPVTTGGRAATTNPTAVADGQVVNAMFTKHGKTVTVDGAPRDLRMSQKTSISNSTAETTIITAGASGVFNDVYGLIFANTGASTTKVDIRDATSGTIIATFEVPTLETRGMMLSAGSALAQTTAANNWTAQCTTATTALEVTALYIKTT